MTMTTHRFLFLFFSVFLIVLLCCSGCLDILQFDNELRYQKQPTNVSYTIEYGYTVECSGSGSYEITYRCDLPAVLQGSVTSIQPLHATSFTEQILVNNSMYVWNLSGDTSNAYQLGVQATVQSQTFLVEDLNGAAAFSRNMIRQQHPELVEHYCQPQDHEGVVYIDPENAQITAQANEIRREANTDNSFALAKALFIWLKEHTVYTIHPDDPTVQSSSETLSKKTGDCDDLSFLYIALCRSLDIPARFIRGYLITTSENMPSIGPHAWAEVFVGGNMGDEGWIPVECACTTDCEGNIHQNFGVEDVAHLRLFVDNGSDESLAFSLSSISWSYAPGMEISAEGFVNVDNYVILNEQNLVVSSDGIRSYEN